MANGVDITIQLLAKSKNLAAGRILERAVKSSHESMRKAAGKTLISAKGGKGSLELIRQFDPSDENLVAIIHENRDRLLPGLRNALGSKDRQLAKNACRIIYTQRIYDALAFMLSLFLEQGDDENDSALSENILRLTAKYVEALEERRNRRYFFGTVLPGVVSVLTQGMKNFHRNDPELILLVFLQIFPYLTEDHHELVQVLRNTSSQAYLSLFRLLQESRSSIVYRFVFYCLNNDSPPAPPLAVFAKRTDPLFIGAILKMLTEPVSQDMRTNLAKIPRIEWLDNIRPLLDYLDGPAQAGMVILIRNLELSTGEVLSLYNDLFRHGKPEGRRAALKAMSTYTGERVDRIIWEAAEDGDPEIQVEALVQLSKRDIPNANSRILHLMDSPHEQVRDTVRRLLPNLRFSSFFASFDQMTEEQRRAMFSVIRKLDPKVPDELAKLLILGSPIDRAKTLLCIEYGKMVPMLEDALCGVLTDDTVPPLRAKAAGLLRDGQRELSRSTLVQALHRDADNEVRNAARSSLEKRPVPWSSPRGDDEESSAV